MRSLFQIVIKNGLRFHHGRGHALSYNGFEALALVLVIEWIVAQVCRLIAASLRLGRIAEASFLGSETCLRLEEGEGGCADGWAEGFEDRRSCESGQSIGSFAKLKKRKSSIPVPRTLRDGRWRLIMSVVAALVSVA